MMNGVALFSALIMFGVSGMVAMASGQDASDASAATQQSAAAGRYHESPMLAALVASGDLPPVDERLPEVPFVVGQGVLIEDEYLDFEIGEFGGTLRLVHDRVGWNPDVFIMGNEPLVMAPTGDISVKGIRGNILHSYEVSDDNRVFTFRMREGLKWSDGMPVTMDDVLFAYEDVLKNEQITASVPGWLRAGNKRDGEPMTLDVVDPWTFRISFSEPYGGFLAQLAIVIWRGYNYMSEAEALPGAVSRQVHPSERSRTDDQGSRVRGGCLVEPVPIERLQQSRLVSAERPRYPQSGAVGDDGYLSRVGVV